MERSSSSYNSDDSSTTALENFDLFEISNFELVSGAAATETSHNFEPPQKLLMESTCNDNNTPVKNDDETSPQDQLFQMLTLISNQMMQNYQDLQTQIAQLEVKFSEKI